MPSCEVVEVVLVTRNRLKYFFKLDAGGEQMTKVKSTTDASKTSSNGSVTEGKAGSGGDKPPPMVQSAWEFNFRVEIV